MLIWSIPCRCKHFCALTRLPTFECSGNKFPSAIKFVFFWVFSYCLLLLRFAIETSSLIIVHMVRSERIIDLWLWMFAYAYGVHHAYFKPNRRSITREKEWERGRESEMEKERASETFAFSTITLFREFLWILNLIVKCTPSSTLSHEMCHRHHPCEYFGRIDQFYTFILTWNDWWFWLQSVSHNQWNDRIY